MQAHNLNKLNHRKKRRVGRGGKRGTYSGRGIKGQKARSGRRIRPQVRDVIKKIHKKRGHGKNYSASSTAFKKRPLVVNLEDLDKKFKAGDKISVTSLLEAGLIKAKSKAVKVKILGRGKLSKKLEFAPEILMSDKVRKLAQK